MNRHLSALALILIIGGSAVAQDKTMPMDMKNMDMTMPMATDSAATKGYKASMRDMMKSMPKFTGDAHVDFMKQMKGHHQAAIDMAKVVLANGKDDETKKLANEIITAQEKEIAMIDAWLKKKGA
jgi:uncharacterized protein (DUF305 family)